MADKQVTYVMNLRGQFESRLNKSNVAAQRFDKSMGSMIARFATFAAVGGVLVNSIKKIADFEEAVSNLSAITGASGDDLDYLKAKAIEMGKATTKSSIDTITAFKLIASSKPELLEDAQALAAVTKEAITLSEASGLDLPSAAKALTSSLNQFGLGADQSSRLINLLAAGSKFAAAEIPDLTASLEEFGGVADSLNVPVEQAAAAVETLSTKGLKGQRAGMMLRNVFLKLGASADRNLNPKIVGLSKSLENLAPIQDNVNELTKMFGRQNVIAAQTLIKQRNRLDELTVAMTDTNIAYEQASINTDNLNSDVKRLSSAWEGFVLNLNQGEGRISGTFRTLTQGLTKLIEKFDDANKSIEELGKSMAEKSFQSTKDYIMRADESFRIPRTKEFIETQKKVIKSIKDKQDADGKTIYLSKKTKKRLATEMEWAQRSLAMLQNLHGELLNPKEIPEVPKLIDDKTGLNLKEEVTRITAGAPKVFNITVQKMTGIETLNTTTIKEGIQQTGASVLEQLQIALADMQVVAS